MGGLIFNPFVHTRLRRTGSAVDGFAGLGAPRPYGAFPALAFGAIGFLDDYEKIAKSRTSALNANRS